MPLMVKKLSRNMYFLAVYLAFWWFNRATKAIPTSGTVVHSPHAVLKGFSPVEGVEAFLGIPYAQPPVNDLRFQPPRRLAGFEGECPVLDASSFGAICWQFHSTAVLNPVNLAETTPQSEDCLNLNIWRPSNTTQDEPLPVMIWLAGGAFCEGGGSIPTYNLENFVKNNPNVIAISINYRLNILGFPSLQNSTFNPNLGLLDQRAAVEWVRDNIAHFGGDPSRITLFGESAGAVSASGYSFLYKDDPIVQAFILESGVATGIGGADGAVWDLVALNVGCKRNGSAAGIQEEEQCMLKVPAARLRAGISNMTVNPVGVPNGGSPKVDNVSVFSVEEYYARAERGDFAKLPVLLGSNNNEGDGVLRFSPEYGLNKTVSELVTKAFTCEVSKFAKSMYDNQVPVWRYRYMPVFPVVTFYDWVRTFHISEVPMVLGSYPLLQPAKQPSQVEVDASKLLGKAWTAFAHDPEHGLEDVMGWPRYNPEEPTLIRLFSNNTVNIDFVNASMYDVNCPAEPTIPLDLIVTPAPTGPPARMRL